MSSEKKRFYDISWDEFQKLSIREKAPFLNSRGRPSNCLVAQQFNRAMLDDLCGLATRVRRIAKSKQGACFLRDLMCHKRAMLYFSQPSTRTFLSFYAACNILGLETSEVRDTATSSEMKGESADDTIRTFSSYFDLLIMRTPVQGFSERMAWVLGNSERPVPIINAGSGKDQHPTQSLLDIYTLQRSFERWGGLEGKSVLFCGDLARGRTVRSLSYLLTNYPNVKQYFVAPEKLQIGSDVLAQLDEAKVQYEVRSDFNATIPLADAIYMTRIQDEWDDSPGESAAVDSSNYYFSKDHLNLLKPSAVILHPLPRRQEIDPEVDSDPRAVYWRQVRNGMWIRVALIATMFKIDPEIHSYYNMNMR